MEDLGVLAAKAATLRVKLANVAALAASPAGESALARLGGWLSGKAFKPVSQMARPQFGTLNALGEEAQALARQQRMSRLTLGLSDKPYFHVQDRVGGGLAGAWLGAYADSKVNGEVNDLSSAGRRAAAVLGGGYLGGKGANSALNVGRKFTANTSPLMGYDTALIPKVSLKSIWNHGVMDRPMGGIARGGSGSEANPRYELLRRYLGIHKNDAAKDMFISNADKSLSFNPAVVKPGSKTWQQYIDPGRQDSSLGVRFSEGLKNPPKLEVPNSAPPKLEVSGNAPAKSLILPGANPEPPRSVLLGGGQPTGPAKKLILPGQEPNAPAPALVMPGQGQAPRPAPKPAAPEKTYSLNEGDLANPPGYSVDQKNNPFNNLFGSHDMRHVQGSVERLPGGKFRTSHELGDTWNFRLDPHETPEAAAYLKGMAGTSPNRWGEFLKQKADIGHASAYGGPDKTVSDRLKNYGMRSVIEAAAQKEAPVIRQRMRFTYEAPTEANAAFAKATGGVAPSEIELLSSNVAGPAVLSPERQQMLRRLLGGSAVAGTGGLYASGQLPSKDTPQAATPQPQPLTPKQEAPASKTWRPRGREALSAFFRKPKSELSTRQKMIRGVTDRAAGGIRSFWDRMQQRYGGSGGLGA